MEDQALARFQRALLTNVKEAFAQLDPDAISPNVITESKRAELREMKRAWGALHVDAVVHDFFSGANAGEHTMNAQQLIANLVDSSSPCSSGFKAFQAPQGGLADLGPNV
jgi:hypothetical protein